MGKASKNGYSKLVEGNNIHPIREKKRKNRTNEGQLECFDSDINVTQGWLLSSTLFGVYINRLEEQRDQKGGEQVIIANIIKKILLYMDEVIFPARECYTAYKTTYRLWRPYTKRWGWMQTKVRATWSYFLSKRS